MTPFWKKFLHEGRGLFSRDAKPRFSLATFGKHPGWDDHIDDIGLDTESLQMAKQIFYIDGIGGQVDTGEWEKLTEEKGLEHFKHIFLWKRGAAFLLGKINSSRDGKNRTKYPMILCAHCTGVSLDWALMHLLPRIEEAEVRCHAVQTADEVRSIIVTTTETLRQAVAQAEDTGASFPPTPFIQSLALENPQEAIYRIIYFIRNQMTGYMNGARSEDESRMRPIEMRLPANRGASVESMVFWTRFLESQLGKDVPFLVTVPLQETWLDVVVGEPTAREFHALRAKPALVTFTSDVPYALDAAFRGENQELVAALLNSGTDFQAPGEPAAQGRRWFGKG